MFTIDWSDATAGDPFADVARTIQMFDFGGNTEPGKIDPGAGGKNEKRPERYHALCQGL